MHPQNSYVTPRRQPKASSPGTSQAQVFGASIHLTIPQLPFSIILRQTATREPSKKNKSLHLSRQLVAAPLKGPLERRAVELAFGTRERAAELISSCPRSDGRPVPPVLVTSPTNALRLDSSNSTQNALAQDIIELPTFTLHRGTTLSPSDPQRVLRPHLSSGHLRDLLFQSLANLEAVPSSTTAASRTGRSARSARIPGATARASTPADTCDKPSSAHLRRGRSTSRSFPKSPPPPGGRGHLALPRLCRARCVVLARAGQLEPGGQHTAVRGVSASFRPNTPYVCFDQWDTASISAASAPRTSRLPDPVFPDPD